MLTGNQPNRSNNPTKQRFGFRSLQFRIFILFFLLLLILQTGTGYLVYIAIRDNFDQQTHEQLITGQLLFIKEQKSRSAYLKNNVQTIAKDWAFRSAVGQGDKKTIRSALANHSNRVQANIALFIGSNQQQIISLPIENPLIKQISSRLPNKSNTTHITYVHNKDKLLQIIIVPVKAPVYVGWLVMGFAVNDQLAKQFSQVTSLDISFIRNIANTQHIIASPIDYSLRASLAAQLPTPLPRQPTKITINNDDYLIRGFSLVDGDNNIAQVLLSQRLTELEADFYSWWAGLLILLTIGTLLSVLLAYFIAQSIAKPVQRLLLAADDVASGNYDNSIDTHSRDEIGGLSRAFNRMQQAIALRERELFHRTSHDDLTDLFNRHGFLDVVDKLLLKTKHLAIIVIDIQHLHQVNDTLGHNVGDQLLQKFSLRLRQTLSNSLHLARIGSSQFAYASLSDQPKTRAVCRKIRESLQEAFILEGVKIYVNTHIGYSLHPSHASDAQTLIRMADVALRQSEETYSDTLCYDPSNDKHTVFRLSLLHELRDAIVNDRMQLYFQPKLQLVDGPLYHHITQVECLIRMHHSDGSLVFPDQFIPLAEKSGAIVDLTEWVINAALQHCQLMRQRNIKMKFAVNISAIDLTAGCLPNRIPQLLNHYQLPADVLVLEVTESAVTDDPEQALQVMDQLKALGLIMSIDDYGTGYSSLAQIKQIPASELKIDRAFIQDITNNQKDPLIVQSTIDMAHGMELQVTAEGIEDAESLQRLEQMHCDFAQGYFIARPMPIEQFFNWLEEGNYPFVALQTEEKLL